MRKRREEGDGRCQSPERPCPALFIDTNLDTHLIVELSDADTVSDVKRKIIVEHPKCHPTLGEIKIDALMVERKGCHYHLSDSMLVKRAFFGVADNWFLFANISSHVQHSEILDLRNNFTGEGPFKMLLDRRDTSSLQVVISRCDDQRVSCSPRRQFRKRKRAQNKKNEVSDVSGPKNVVARLCIANSSDSQEMSDPVDGLQQNYRRVNKKRRVENGNVVEDPVLGNQPLVCSSKKEMNGLEARLQKRDLERGSVHFGTHIESLAVNAEETLEGNLIRDVSEGHENRVLNGLSVENEMSSAAVALPSIVDRLRRTKKNSAFASNFLLLMEESDKMKNRSELSEDEYNLADIHRRVPENTACVEQERLFSNNEDPEVVMSECEQLTLKEDKKVKPGDSAGIQQKTNNFSEPETQPLRQEATNCEGHVNDEAKSTTQDVEPALLPQFVGAEGKSAKPGKETRSKQAIAESNLGALPFKELRNRDKDLLPADDKIEQAGACKISAHKIRNKVKPAESNLDARNDVDAELGSSAHMKYKLEDSDNVNIVQDNNHIECKRVAGVGQKVGNDDEAMESVQKEKEDKKMKSGSSTIKKQKTRKVKNSFTLKTMLVPGMTDGVSVPSVNDEATGTSQKDMGPLASTQLARAEENPVKSEKPNKKSKRKQTVEESPMKDQDIGVKDLSVEGKMERVSCYKTNNKAKSAGSKLEARIDKDAAHGSFHPMKTSVELSNNIDVAPDNYQSEPEKTDNLVEQIELPKNTDPEVIVFGHGNLISDGKEDKEFKYGSSAGKKKKLKKDKNCDAPKAKHLTEMTAEISVDKAAETSQGQVEPVSLTQSRAEDNAEEKIEKPKKRTQRKQAVAESKISGLSVKEQDSALSDPFVDKAAETSQGQLEPVSLTQSRAEDNAEEKIEKPKKRTQRKQAIAESKISGLSVKEQDSALSDPFVDGKIIAASVHETEGMAKLAAPDMEDRSDRDRQRGSSHGTTSYAEISKSEDVADSYHNEPENSGSAGQQLELQKKNDPGVVMSEDGLLVLDRKEDEEIKSGRSAGKKNTRKVKKSAAPKTRHSTETIINMSVDEAAETSQKKLESVSLGQLEVEGNVKENIEKPKKRTRRKQAIAESNISGLPVKKQGNNITDSSVDEKTQRVSVHKTEGMAMSSAPDMEVSNDKDGGRGLSHGTTSFIDLSRNENAVPDSRYDEPGNHGSAEQQLELQKSNDPEIMMSEEGLLNSDMKKDEATMSGVSAGKRQETRVAKNSAASKTKHLTQTSADVLVDEVDNPIEKNTEPESLTQLLKTEKNAEEKSEKPKKKTKRKKISEIELSDFPVIEQQSHIRDPSLNDKIRGSGHATKVKANSAAAKLEAKSDENVFAPLNSAEVDFGEARPRVELSVEGTNQMDQKQVARDEINQLNKSNLSTDLTNQTKFSVVRSHESHAINASLDPDDLAKVNKLDAQHEGKKKSKHLEQPPSISKSPTVQDLLNSNKSGGAEGHSQSTNAIGVEMHLGQVSSIHETFSQQNLAKTGSSSGTERNTEGGSSTQHRNSVSTYKGQKSLLNIKAEPTKVSSEDGEQLHGMPVEPILPRGTNAPEVRIVHVNVHDENEASMSSSAGLDAVTTQKKQPRGRKTKLEQRQQTHPKLTSYMTAEAAVPQRTNGPKKNDIALANMTDENETSMTSNGGSGMQGTRKQANRQKPEFKRHQVGSRNLSYKKKEDVGGGLLQKKNVLASSGAIFMDESGSSEDESQSTKDGSRYRSNSSTRTSSESSSADYSEESQTQNGFPNGDESDVENSLLTNTKHVPLESMLRSSSRYKKAKMVAASQSQQHDTESQPVDFVPDSQTNL